MCPSFHRQSHQRRKNHGHEGNRDQRGMGAAVVGVWGVEQGDMGERVSADQDVAQK